jgi:hypothetical protein
MAVLVSTNSGNWSSSSSWCVVDSTSLLTNAVADTTIGSSSQSSSFTPGAITLSGICVYLASRTATPSGTLTAGICFTNGTLVTNGSVTVNVSDFPSTSTVGANTIGWTFFRFPAPVTLTAATAYAVTLRTSQSNQMSAWRDSTVSNFLRALVTTTNAAVATADTMMVLGEFTAAGVNSTKTITMDNTTSANTYGGVAIGLYGILSYGTNASTNYSLRLRGPGTSMVANTSLLMGHFSTLNIGTSANTIPSTSTAVLEFSASSQASHFQNYGGTFNVYGSPITYVTAKLSGDVAVGATTTVTDVSTGWKVNDSIVIATTSATTTQNEQRTITGITTNTIGHSAYTFPHGGNSITLVQADIINLTRNVKILSTSSTNRAGNLCVGYTSTNPAVNNLNYGEFINMGTGTLGTGGAISLGNFSNATISGCSFYLSVTNTAVYNGILTTNSSTANAGVLNLYDTVFYNGGFAINQSLPGLPVTFNNIYSIQNASGFILAGLTGTCTNITAAGSSTRGVQIGAANSNVTFGLQITNGNFYGNAVGMSVLGINPTSTLNLNNLKFWRNTTQLNNIIGGSTLIQTNKLTSVVINNSYFFGSSNGHITYNAFGRIIYNNSYFWGGSGATSTWAISNAASVINYSDTIFFNNCLFGVDYLGNSNPFTTAAINTVYPNGTAMVFKDCVFSGTESANQAGISLGISSINGPFGFVSLNHNRVSGSNKFFNSIGQMTTDSVIFNIMNPSLRITPTSSTFKIRTNFFRVPVQSGQTCNISVWVRKSISTDPSGANYNGAQPRLIFQYNPYVGGDVDIVGATFSDPNLFSFAQDFNNAYWTKSNVTISGNTTIAPDNTSSADLVSLNAGNSVKALFRTLGFTMNGNYVGSFYLKDNTQRFVQILFGGDPNNFANIDLQLGIISNRGISGSTSITDVGNGWYRCAFFINSSTAFSFAVAGTTSLTGARDTALTSTGSYFVWGAQLTTGTTLNDYVPDGTWQQLTYTTPVITGTTTCEFYVDCDGTTGWINVDDWATTTFNNSKGGAYWSPMGQYVEPDFRNPGGSYTFIT